MNRLESLVQHKGKILESTCILIYNGAKKESLHKRLQPRYELHRDDIILALGILYFIPREIEKSPVDVARRWSGPTQVPLSMPR